MKGAAGAAAAGAVTLASTRTAQAAAIPATDRTGAFTPAAVPNQVDHSATDQTIVVHVRDARTGQLDLFVGERHVQVRDRDLAARLIAAAR